MFFPILLCRPSKHTRLSYIVGQLSLESCKSGVESKNHNIGLKLSSSAIVNAKDEVQKYGAFLRLLRRPTLHLITDKPLILEKHDLLYGNQYRVDKFEDPVTPSFNIWSTSALIISYMRGFCRSVLLYDRCGF